MDAADGLPPRQRRWAVLSLAVSISIIVIDMSLANVALPTIARDLGVDSSSAIWVVNAYQMAVTVSLLPLSALGDVVGYRRIYLTGLVVFAVGAIVSASADGLAMLVAARLAQGFGGGAIMSVNAALVRYVYPRSHLGRGIGLNSLIVATASATGPTLSSLVLSVASWPWLFAIGVPAGTLAFLLARRSIPPMTGSGHPFDLPSAALSVITIGLAVGAMDGLAHGERLLAGVAAAAAIGCGWTFVRRQRGLAAPVLAVDLFRRPAFSLSAATAILCYSAQALGMVSLPFLLVEGAGRTQVEAGFLMTAWPIAVAAVAPISGRLADSWPVGVLAGIGLAAMTSGLLALALMPASPAAPDIIWRMALCGLGFGFFQAPNNRALLTSVPRERSGAAGGVLSVSRLMGQTTGAALVAVVLGLAAARPGDGHGAVGALLLGSAIAAVGMVVSLARLCARGRDTD
ncbi:MAG: MFS transporter [Alphaproteobacteria bacterium]